MKKVISLVAASLLLAQLTACGNAMMPAAGMRPMGPTQVTSQSILGINKEIGKAVEANFKSKDKNGDGFITPNEFPVESPEDFNHFRRFDNNKDGRLVVKEMAPGLFSRIGDIFQLKATAAFLFDELDVDNNKQLTKSEVESCKIPGVAATYDAYLGKTLFGKHLDYLRKTDFENLMAFALTNPAAAGSGGQAPASQLAPKPVK
ncbi:MAG: hypothetical protein ACAI44_30405 [Candidatus Sericytochromatia bacterium]